MKKILGILIALMIATPAFASIAVSPTRVEINANKIKTNYITTAIDIKGDSKTPMRFKVYPAFFTIDENGEVVLAKRGTDNPNDLSKKIRFVPSEFTVAQGKNQKVRINIAGLKLLPDGENRTMLFFEDVNPKEYAIDSGREGIGAQLIVKTRIGVPVYVDKGKVSKFADIEYLNIVQEKNGLYTNMKVLSKGNSRIRYTGKVQIIQGKKLIDEYDISGRTVGENNYYISKDKVKTDKIEEAGDYTLRVVLSYFDENGKRQNVKKEAILKIQGNV